MSLFERVTLIELISFCETHKLQVVVNDGRIIKLESTF